MIGKIFGNRYELIEQVGTGGMAVVYKAKCRLLNRFVAVKVLKEEYISDAVLLEKFSKEAQAAASLSHPNIVNIYDVGKEGEIPYIVMEYISGRTLKSYISQHQGFLTNDQIANFSRQVALALEHAHSNQIIHRDIKPHNILLSPDGTLKVADFGIASAVSEATASYTGEAVGSVKYASPEQARGRHVDQRTDLYSLGVLMYEMATLQVPFQGDSAVEIALKHMRDDVMPPREINRSFHKGLESIVMRSLLKDISQRYQNARELIDDLEKIINNPNENVAFYDFDLDAATQKIPSLKEFDRTEEGETRKMKKKTTSNNNKKYKYDVKTLLPLIGVVLLAFLTVLIIFIFTRLGPANKITATDNIILPDVVNQSFEEGKALLESEGLKVIEGSLEKNNEVAPGYISSQSPRAGQKVRPNYTVTLNISEGATTAEIPSVTFKTLNEAEVLIENTKFTLGEIDYVNDDLDKGFVIAQLPAAGTTAKDDEVIYLTVSLGPEHNQVVVPRLTNLSLTDTQRRLIELGLDVGEIEYEIHPSIEKDHVISQSISEGTEVEAGVLIDIILSLGTEEEEEEEPVEGDATTSTKAYNVPVGSYVGETIDITVLFEQDGMVETLYNASHTIEESTGAIFVEVTGTGKGILNFLINGQLNNSTSVDFSN
jgi:serine/threonine-protein kinase